MRGRASNVDLKILNVLMREKNFVPTTRLQEIVGCERKSVYNAIDTLETNGFGIEVEKRWRENYYKYIGTYGF